MSKLRSSGGSLFELTEKQREVLDLLIEHKTSKEIALELGISPHTVEQRLRYAKAKLGIDRRSDLASTYRRLRDTYKETVYDDSYVERSAIPLSKKGESSEPQGLILTKGVDDESPPETDIDQSPMVRLVPEALEGRSGTWMRIVAVFAVAVGILIIWLLAMAVLEQLSRLIV